MAKQCMLSTRDNIFNPFEQWDDWYSFDKDMGYDSSEKLMRLAKLEEGMTMFEENAEIERAIDSLIKHDPLNIFIKVEKELIIPED